MGKQIELANKFLANQTVLYMKLHNLHWYLKGSSFFTLHAEYEKLYDQTHEIIDEVAERLLILGHVPIASLKEALSLSTIEERVAAPVDGPESVEIILKDIEALLVEIKDIISASGEDGDEGTADQFTGYLKDYQKLSWLLRSYLKK